MVRDALPFKRCSKCRTVIAKEHNFCFVCGAPLGDIAFAPRTTTGPLRILFVGGIGQRKGIKYLLEAYQRIRNAGTELAGRHGRNGTCLLRSDA